MYMYTVSVGALIFALNDNLKVMLHVTHCSLLVKYTVPVALAIFLWAFCMFLTSLEQLSPLLVIAPP